MRLNAHLVLGSGACQIKSFIQMIQFLFYRIESGWLVVHHHLPFGIQRKTR